MDVADHSRGEGPGEGAPDSIPDSAPDRGHGAVLARVLAGDRPADLRRHRGQFHDVVVGSRRVVCFARTQAAGARLAGRAAVLRAVAGLGLGVRVPEPLAQGGGAAGPEPPHLVLTRVPGAPLDPARLRERAVADAVADQYAALLRRLADAGAAAARGGLPGTPRDRWHRFAADVRDGLLPLMSAAGRARAERELAAARGLPHRESALVHGDLGPENVLWEWSGGLPRLSGVVDWDGAAVGDPAGDLAAVAAGHGDALLAAVLARVGAPPDTAERVAALRGTFALQQALGALRDGDAAELADGLRGYR
ncbi:aminoglycoside phosphotransferase (APT) family kinase protein [Streptomonospora nanhaiensis]|uniref:Aminoglycoside phosphotransferase (APT) family kinase protein n=1 Tax=Streptomonospora nanhaiensis TaxID=1323731 RepID=A0A853BVX4_9ACTN|nr:phosphotransferase [Streptomonospora nanhaiensis]NYI99130.1 aminoglycoside phosphotransferase (APT) family kinase protein [Streptomonospora nanhaiensis]